MKNKYKNKFKEVEEYAKRKGLTLIYAYTADKKEARISYVGDVGDALLIHQALGDYLRQNFKKE